MKKRGRGRPKKQRRLTHDEAQEILLTVTSGERTCYSWAKELGVTVSTVSCIVHGKTHADVAPDVLRFKGSLSGGSNGTRWDAWHAELAEVRRMARAASELRVAMGGLREADVDAWVEGQVEAHREERREEKRRARRAAARGRTDHAQDA